MVGSEEVPLRTSCTLSSENSAEQTFLVIFMDCCHKLLT